MSSWIYKSILIEKDRFFLITKGLKKAIGYEIKIHTVKLDTNKYLEVLEYLIDYVAVVDTVFRDKQTIAYCSWILQFVHEGENLTMWEADIDGSGYHLGVDYAVEITNKQKEICLKHNTAPIFPIFDQQIVISKGIYEGMPVNAVRYPSPGHMTGWWLITSLYDDNIQSLMTVHYYHVAFKRPDILPFLALPSGFRFGIGGDELDIWFDKNVLK